MQGESQFNPRYNVGNPIRKIGDAAANIERTTAIKVLKFHIGNPTTRQLEVVKQATIKSIRERPSGYDPHPGTDEQREQVAKFFNDSEGVGEHFSGQDVCLAPGATSITKALCDVFVRNQGDGVLISTPGYGTYRLQVGSAKGQPVGYALDENNLITFEQLDKKIELFEQGEKKARLLIVNYPHNPTGKTLNKQEAEQVAGVVNRLAEKHPHLVFYNDAVYNATVVPEKGYNSFYQHLSDVAKNRTVTGVSGSKMTAQGAERIAAFACKNKTLMPKLIKAMSFNNAGVNTHAAEGFVAALQKLRGTFSSSEYDPTNARHNIARYYGERRKSVMGCISTINIKFDEHKPPIKAEDTGGSMFLWVDFGTLKGANIPPKMQAAVGSKKLETGEQLKNFMLNLHKVGYQPVSICHGAAFGLPADSMEARISCVDRSLENFGKFSHSLKGAVQLLTGIDMGVEPKGREELDKVAKSQQAMLGVGRGNLSAKL